MILYRSIGRKVVFGRGPWLQSLVLAYAFSFDSLLSLLTFVVLTYFVIYLSCVIKIM